MKITKVKFEKLFPVGAYLNEKIGFEAEIDFGYNMDKQMTEPMESAESVLSQLRQLAEDCHKEKYPHLYNGNEQQEVQGTTITNIPTEAPNHNDKERSREEVIAAHLITIGECKTLRNLEMFANMVQRENDDRLYEAYNNKKKELTT